MNKFSMRLLPVACAAGLLLSACGGGGGGGDPVPTSPGITATNYPDVAEPVAESMLSVMTTADSLRGFTGLEQTAEAGQTPARTADPVGLLRSLMASRAVGLEKAQQTQGERLSCPQGGYMDVSLTDADNSATLSRGDSANIQFQACTVEGETVSGGLGISVTALGASSGSLSLSFNGLSAQGATLSGGAAVSFTIGTVNSMSVTLSNATFSDGGTSVRANYTVDLATSAGSSSVAVHGNVVMDGHNYALTQPTPFVRFSGGSMQPGGVLQIREAAFGERVLVKAGTSHFTYDYFSATNTGGTPDHSSTGLAY